jgi:hypothetical protein
MGWHLHNLTQEGAVAPAANGAPTSHVVDDAATERTQHVFYAGLFLPSMLELWWTGSAIPQWEDLVHDHPGEIGLLSDSLQPPASHVFRAEGTQHVFCRGSSETFSNHVFELWWRGGDPVNVNDLMAQSGEPTVGATSLTSHVFEAEGTQHVYFTMFGQIEQEQVDGHVGELWWRRGESAHLEDLTARSRARTLASAGLASHVAEEAGTQHVFYVAGTDVVELSWGGGHDWRERNLSQSSSPDRRSLRRASQPATSSRTIAPTTSSTPPTTPGSWSFRGGLARIPWFGTSREAAWGTASPRWPSVHRGATCSTLNSPSRSTTPGRTATLSSCGGHRMMLLVTRT